MCIKKSIDMNFVNCSFAILLPIFAFILLMPAEKKCSSDNIIEKTSDVIQSNDFETNVNFVPKYWWLQTYACGLVTTYCCCSDGNSMVCNLPGTGISCLSGGIFNCDSDLSGCGENPSNCDPGCCPECA